MPRRKLVTKQTVRLYSSTEWNKLQRGMKATEQDFSTFMIEAGLRYAADLKKGNRSGNLAKKNLR
jgi:hypothetical protein